jgi:diguanylate cyclase (GGDEF)-like protein/PAS domain S-box-containing protein
MNTALPSLSTARALLGRSSSGAFPRISLWSTLGVLGVISVLTVIWSVLRYQEFVAGQERLLRATVHGTSEQVALLLDEQRRAVDVFIREHGATIATLAADPGGVEAHEAVAEHVRLHFPDHLAFSVADSQGHIDAFLPEGLMGKRCKLDLQAFSVDPARYRVYMHVEGGPETRHYDLMGKWVDGMRSGVFFVSFFPARLTQLLGDNHLPGYTLLLTRDQRVDLAERESHATAEASGDLPNGSFKATVRGSQWQLLGVPDEGLFANKAEDLARQAVMLILAFWVIGMALIASIRRVEHVRQRAERVLSEAYAGLEKQIAQRTSELRGGNERLQREIESRTAVQRQLAEQKEFAETTLSAIGDAVITTDMHGRVTYLNPMAQRLTGWTLAKAVDKPLGEVLRLLDADTEAEMSIPLDRILAGDDAMEPLRGLLLGSDGKRTPVADSCASMLRPGGVRRGAVLVFHDVTVEQRLMNNMRHQASHDPLTGLVNRREFEVRLEAAVKDAAHFGETQSLCFLDLDHFNLVNDTCGHTQGDRLLKQLTTILRHRVKSIDTLARVGGDEFALILKRCDVEQAREVAQRALEEISRFRFECQDRQFEVGASVGIAPIEAGLDVSELLSRADLACRVAKEAGRGRIHIYRESDAELSHRRDAMRMAARLSAALERDSLTLYGQPVLPVQEGGQGYVEVLVRMLDDDGTLVMPSTFIPAAERYGLATRLDRWVIRHAFETYARAGAPEITLAINLSGHSLGDAGLTRYVREQLERHGVPPGHITFEVTESQAVQDLDAALSFVHEMHRLGCRFALDDFGVGVSSFSYLRMLPVDGIKVDGGFVKRMMSDRADHAIVAAVAEIGRVMNISTVAEFVVDAAILDKVRELGIDYAQGYHLGEPVPLEQSLAQALAATNASRSSMRSIRAPAPRDSGTPSLLA